MASVLVVSSKVKALIKPHRTGADAIEALSDHVETVMKRAEEASKARGAMTVNAKDISQAINSP